MKNDEKALYYMVDRIVGQSPKSAFTKTLRGLKLNNLEFTFATDKKLDDNCVVVVGRKDIHCVRSPKIRQRLLEIYHG